MQRVLSAVREDVVLALQEVAVTGWSVHCHATLPLSICSAFDEFIFYFGCCTTVWKYLKIIWVVFGLRFTGRGAHRRGLRLGQTLRGPVKSEVRRGHLSGTAWRRGRTPRKTRSRDLVEIGVPVWQRLRVGCSIVGMFGRVQLAGTTAVHLLARQAEMHRCISMYFRARSAHRIMNRNKDCR